MFHRVIFGGNLGEVISETNIAEVISRANGKFERQ